MTFLLKTPKSSSLPSTERQRRKNPHENQERQHFQQQCDGAGIPCVASPEKGQNAQHDKEVASNGAIVIEGGQIVVTVAETATYTLQVIDAKGNPVQTLFKGTWNEGVHYVSVENTTLTPNNYLVLIRNGSILNKVRIE